MLDPESEPLCSFLALKSLSIKKPLFQTSNSCVYAAYNHIFAQAVALKLQCYSSKFSSAVALREVYNQRRVCHENVVKLYRHFQLDLDGNWWVLGLEMELMATDLSKEIRRRATNAEYWSEEELKGFLCIMVEVLAEAQLLAVAHRDIKPHNIFVDGPTFKLGDFGWSRLLPEEPDPFMTLSGTPVYLSPILKRGLLLRETRVRHHPFKSDVFSLGLTVLNMARLAEAGFSLDQATIEATVSGVRYPAWVKSVLGLMLQVEESTRPDFLSLLSLLKATNAVDTACTHSARSVCGKCLDSEVLRENSRIYSGAGGGGQLLETPQGLEGCARCGKMAALRDLIVMSDGKVVGLYCGKCLVDCLDEEETAKRCQSSKLYFVYQSLLRSL